MSSCKSDDGMTSGREDSSNSLSPSGEDDSGSEAVEPRPQHKKRRLDGGDALSLELVTAALLQGAAAHIDTSEEAEASLLQLEVKDLLREARPDLGLEAELLELVRTLAAQLRALPQAQVAAEGGAAAAIRGFLSDLAFQPVRPFVFRPPALVQVVGSFGLCAAVRPSPCLDLALLIPAACLDTKDQLNHRYFAKRALYLAHIAAALKGHPQLSSVGWECLADDPRRPVLVLHPHQGLSPGGFCIRLLPAAPPELCPLTRLVPDRNNLRSAVAPPPPPAPPPEAAVEAVPATTNGAGKGGKGGKAAKGAKGGKQQKQLQQQQKMAAAAPAPAPQQPQEPQLLPTPHYNTSVLQDLLMLPLAEACRAAAAGCPQFADAAALLRVWVRQQQLERGADGLTGCFLTLLLVHLIEGGQASAAMPAMHLFRTVLVALSGTRTFTPGLFMQRRQPGSGGSSSSVQPPDAKAWRKAFEVVFVDSSGWLNLAAGVSKSALAAARGAASRSLQLLSNGTPEAFDAIFLARQQQAALCDYWFHVRVPPQPTAAVAAAAARGGSEGSKELQGDRPAWRAIEQRVEALATNALGDRARLVRVFQRTLQQRQHRGSGKAPFERSAALPHQQHVLLGVQVDATAALRGLDLGPSADKAEAARAFRAFWGDLADLRRFQDGAIAEAVVWEEDPAQRHLIVDSIVSYILQRHLPAGTSVVCHAAVLDIVLCRRHSTPQADVAAARLCEAAAERLGKRLRTLAADSLPLRVVAVQALAPVLRHAAAFPPLPQLLAGAAADALASEHVARCLQPVELLCQLEGSGRWPDDPEAFQKMKAALGCQLAQQLHTALGMEASAAEGWVDVLADGFAFRLLLATERDAAMQHRVARLGGEVWVPAEADMPLRTWHQGAVAGVAGENPAFEPAVRLAKRWVGAHLLSPHLGEEAVELLMTHCFTAGGRTVGGSGGGGGGRRTPAVATTPAPASRLSGLLCFLQLLAEHPWRVQPLVVDPNRELSAAQRDAVVRQHGVARAKGAAPLLCLVTPRDTGGGAWTHGRPSSQILPRISVLAQRSAAALEALLLGGGGGGDDTAAAAAAVCAIFSRDLAEYDVIIRLRPDALPNAANDLQLGTAAAGTASSATAAGAATQQLGPALQVANEQLAAMAATATTAPGSRHSRAILKGIPQSVLVARGHHAVRRELLVGFDPLPLYTHLLQQHLGDLAVACADYTGGSVVALKWRAAALAPAPLRAEAAHLACPAGSAQAAPAKELLAARRKAAAGSSAGTSPAVDTTSARHAGLSAAVVVPDVVGVLADVLSLGEGLVDSVVLQ